QYDFRPLDIRQGQLVPQDLEAVILIRPKHLTDREKYAIDQYLVGGGKLVIFADSHELEVRDDIQNQIRIEPVPYDHKHAKLKFIDQLAHYGAGVEDRIVSDGWRPAWQVYGFLFQDPRTGQTGLAPIDYPYLFEALDVDWRKHADLFAKDASGKVNEVQANVLRNTLKPGVTKDHDLMSQVLRVGIPGMFWPCPVNLTETLPQDVKGEVLLRTSPLGWDEKPGREIDPYGRYRDHRGREAEYDKWCRTLQMTRQVTPPKQIGLMVHLEGRFSSFFAGKDIPPRPMQEGEAKEADPLDWDKDQEDKAEAEQKPDTVGPLPAGKQPAPDPQKEPPMLAKATKPGSLLVIGDADFVRDDYLSPAYSQPAPKSVPPVVIGPMPKDWQRPERAARFFMNVLSWLAEEEDLLELNNKTPTDRTLTLLTHDSAGGESARDFQERLESRTGWIRRANTLFPCLLLVLAGVIIALRRRSQKVAFLNSLGAAVGQAVRPAVEEQ
ncbi:MAG: Gldg family protein, partial [Planctomycetota bacterium]